ncbi:MAG TPA: GNAT family N-acetyltransferase [Polyangia bacterium]
MTNPRWSVEWRRDGALLCAREPTEAEVREAAPALAAFYNEPHNQRMLANTLSLTVEDVVSFYADLRDDDGRPLLLWRDGVLVGDADLRRVDRAARTGEFAILIGERAVQGQGLGTRFATMAHLFAFTALGLERVYVSIVAGNVASARMLEKVGYRRDDAPVARGHADEAGDVTMSLTRADFEAACAGSLAAIALRQREP